MARIWILVGALVIMVSTSSAFAAGKVKCGGIGGQQCAAGMACDLPAGKCKGADLQGTCKKKPEVCPKHIRRVCGCDGKTYNNDCERLMAGVQKDHNGKCRTK